MRKRLKLRKIHNKLILECILNQNFIFGEYALAILGPYLPHESKAEPGSIEATDPEKCLFLPAPFFDVGRPWYLPAGKNEG